MNIIDTYFNVKNKPIIRKSEMARQLRVSQPFIDRMQKGETPIPDAKKLDVYLITFPSLPVNAKRYVIEDVDTMLQEHIVETERMVRALEVFQQ